MNRQSCFAAVIVSGVFGIACDPPARELPPVVSAPWDRARIDTLLQYGRDDQQGRHALAQAAVAQDTSVLLATMQADSLRTRWLRDAVARHGWPVRATTSDTAANAAWLILQHSPDTAWQAAMLPELERLGRAGELPLSDLALLTDRIRMHRGQLQRYGSQFNVVDGRLVPAPTESLPGLDARRAAMGLPPMSEYVRMLSEQTKLPVTWPPES